MISELHSAFHKLGRIANKGQGQCHNYGIEHRSEWEVVYFVMVVGSNLVEVVVDSNLVAEVVVDSNLVAVDSNLVEAVELVGVLVVE